MLNRNQGRFLKSAMGTIRGFTDGCLIMGDDPNVALDPSLDTSSGTSSTPHHIINSINTCLREHQLVDCWRAKYLEDQDYTFFSIPNQTYSRQDFFLPHYFLRDLNKAHIETNTWSDHASILMTLSSPPPVGPVGDSRFSQTPHSLLLGKRDNIYCPHGPVGGQ
ncbi:Hypothetical predicted protein [Pelobates cultripes]|uniref:Endonuclease/exonuclease/phosphatase domain-containing protein n=1 Tax=Pelobates cultripes TaxID=61616 RepID=A0AAD1SFY4_PELCU|nr:Hypothetical predicted protein [Pelobates cultripes]